MVLIALGNFEAESKPMKVRLEDGKEIMVLHPRRVLRSIIKGKGPLGLLIKKYEVLRSFTEKHKIFTSVPDNQMVWSDFENHKWIRRLYHEECRTAVVHEKEDSINPVLIRQAICIDKKKCITCNPVIVTYQLVQGTYMHETGKEIFKLIDKKVTLAFIPRYKH